MTKNLAVAVIGTVAMLLLSVPTTADVLEKNTAAGQEPLGHIGLGALPVYDVEFYSESLQRNMHINVVLPRGYEELGISYPTLYLCHGFTSNYHEFENIGVPEYLNRFDMIVVMVDVGNSSYVNWAQSDDGRPYKFADHVCKDVINYVDKNYRTIAERKGRAINGISMGGGGAISLGLSHPELFCSIASHSGSVGMGARARAALERDEGEGNPRRARMMEDPTRYLDIDIEGFSTFKERTPVGKPFLTVEDVDKVDPFKLVLEIPKNMLPHIYLDCGYDDFLIEQTQSFAKLLMDNKIPFQLGQSDGVHEENYWGREVSVSMAVQYAIMLRNIWGKEFDIYDPYKK
jgi:S-formylglutathione hydrolase FrmB